MTIRKLKNSKTIKQIQNYNNGYCPCSLTKTEDDKCMCKDFRDKIEDSNWFGQCGCGLYEKVED